MQSNARCPFSPEEITLYRRFKAYDFDNDTEFQRDYSHSNDTPSADLVDSLTAEQALQLQNKVAYFTRKYGDIDIKKYIQWQKAMQAMTNEKNTSTVDNSKKMSSTAYSQLPYTMRRFIEYDFDNDKQFQTDLPELLRHVHENGSLDTAATATDDIDERKLIRAKLAYFDKHLLPLTWDEYIAAMEPPVNNTTMSTVTATDTTPVKCPITGQLASSDQQQCPVLGAMTDTSGHDVSSPVKPFEPTNATLIVYAHPTRKNGSKGGLDEITMYESTSMNEVQVGKLRQTIEQSIRHEPAALLLTADTMQSVDQYGDSSRAIETRDWRVFSSPPSSVKAAEAYAQLLNELGSDSEGNPPLVVVFNGRVSPMTMNWFSVAKTRVCTEDIVVRPARPLSDESLTYWPVNGLYTLTHLNRVAGIGLYLQFNPQVTLRTPDCLSLGLIDRFVPEKFLGDWLRQLRSTFPVGGETNVTVIVHQLKDMVLSGDKQWPGCSVIECWESEIQQCFEDTTSVEQMLEKLEQQGKPWMQATVKYIHSLPPLLVKIMYRAIREASQLNWQRCNELELLIARNWSKSIDAHRLRNLQMTGEQTSWKYVTLASVTDKVLDEYFSTSSVESNTTNNPDVAMAESSRQDITTLNVHCYRSPWQHIDTSIDYAAFDALRPRCPYFHR